MKKYWQKKIKPGIDDNASGKILTEGPSERVRYKRLHQVILVEDDIDDQFFAKDQLKQIESIGKIECFSNGKDLVRHLHDCIEKDKDFLLSTSTFIILDLNMPLMNGLEVLQTLKSDSALKNIPVIVVTGEESEWEIDKAFRSKADAVFKKPLSTHKLSAFLESRTHWPRSSPSLRGAKVEKFY